MDVQSVLLGFLMRYEMSGYDLKQAISISFSFFSSISYGSIYPALKSLHRKELVSMQILEGEKGPVRKVYAITPAGREVFLQALSAPVTYDNSRKTFLPRLFFFAHLTADQRRELTLAFRRSIREIIGHLQTSLPVIETRADPFQRMCAEFGMRMLQDLVANVDRILDDLHTLETPEAP